MAEKQRNIYYLYGEEDFLIQDEIRKIKKAVFAPGQAAGVIERFDADNDDFSVIEPQLKTSSLFGDKRIVVLEGYDDKDYEKIIDSKNDIPDSLHIIIVSNKANKNSGLFKTLQKIASVKEFKPFAEWEETRLVSWIVSRAGSLSKKIAPDTASLLKDVCGSSLFKLSSEIEKITAYIGDKTEIVKKDINDLATSGDISSFALENAFAKRDLKEALSTLFVSLKSKEPPVVILSKIYSRARVFLKIKDLKEKKYSRDSIIQEMSMNPYFFKRCEIGADSYTKDELIKAFELILKTDITLKNSMQSPQALLELLFVDIMSRGNK